MTVEDLEGSLEEDGLLKKCTPVVGMEFESEEAGFRFYNEYGRIMGFSIRRDYHTKSRTDGLMINRKLVCSKEGEKNKKVQIATQPRRETRTKCSASLYISLDRESSKWVVKKFDDIHNHLLHLPECAHMMASQRKLCETQGINVEIADTTGLSLKESHDLISAQVGGKEFVGFTLEDQKSYLRAKRQRNLQYGEAGALLRYFHEQVVDSPYFFQATQLDVDEMITNMFWADHQMIVDYGLFGDAVSFDTTFRTNKDYRPLALFTGFNHFRMTVVFGAALLYDESCDSFKWLFETFLRAMSGKRPITIFTDQDHAIGKAISEIMPNVTHGLCTFHLMQNALKHLGYLFKGESRFDRDFKACIFNYEEENELTEAWNALIVEYNLEENTWMQKTWELREKWAHVYLKWSYSAGMRSTQLSESLNSKMKRYLKSDLNIDQFFTHFTRVVVDTRYNEKKATYDSRQKLARVEFNSSPMLIQIAKVYTPPVFELFHDQFDASLACQVRRCHELGGEIRFVIEKYGAGRGREYIVVCDMEIDEFGGKTCQQIRCSCRLFESFGILCGHVIRALQQMNVMEIPERYILDRWKLDVKVSSLSEGKVIEKEVDPKLVTSARYRHLCPRMVKLAALSSEHDDAYELVDAAITDLFSKVEAIALGRSSSTSPGGCPTKMELDLAHSIDPNLARAKGLKKIQGKRTRRKGGRLLSWHEKIRKTAKAVKRSRVSLDIQAPYRPQVMRYGENFVTHDISKPPLSSQASYHPQFVQEFELARDIPGDQEEHSAMDTESLFNDEGFLNFLSKSQPTAPQS